MKSALHTELSITKQSAEFTDVRISKYRMAMSNIFAEYMASDDWKQVRAAVRDNANGKCTKCGKFVNDGGVAHHEYYEHWGKANYEEINSCVYLCKKCHKHVPHNYAPFFAKQNFDPYVVDLDDLRRAIDSLHEDSKF